MKIKIKIKKKDENEKKMKMKNEEKLVPWYNELLEFFLQTN